MEKIELQISRTSGESGPQSWNAAHDLGNLVFRYAHEIILSGRRCVVPRITLCVAEGERAVTADAAFHDFDRSLLGVGYRAGCRLARQNCYVACTAVVAAESALVPARLRRFTDAVGADGCGSQIIDRLASDVGVSSDRAHAEVAGEAECPVCTNRVLHDPDRALFGIGDRAGRRLA